MKISEKKAQLKEQMIPSGYTISSDGESLKAKEVNLVINVKSYKGDDRSGILCGYASLDDYYLKYSSISKSMSSFSASSIGADNITNKKMHLESPTEEDT
eukprot:2522054-Ditylum_brightwellii.AAC.1